MRVRRLPEQEHFYAAFFPNFEIGLEAVRAIAQSELALSMVRLSDPMETETTFQLSGEEKLVDRQKRPEPVWPGRGALHVDLRADRLKSRKSLADRQLAHIVRSHIRG
jgi:hypothetical protein